MTNTSPCLQGPPPSVPRPQQTNPISSTPMPSQSSQRHLPPLPSPSSPHHHPPPQTGHGHHGGGGHGGGHGSPSHSIPTTGTQAHRTGSGNRIGKIIRNGRLHNKCYCIRFRENIHYRDKFDWNCFNSKYCLEIHAVSRTNPQFPGRTPDANNRGLVWEIFFFDYIFRLVAVVGFSESLKIFWYPGWATIVAYIRGLVWKIFYLYLLVAVVGLTATNKTL